MAILLKVLQSMLQSLSGNKTKWTPFSKKGISIIEILVVIFILAIAFASILGLLTFSLRVSTLIKENTQAINLAKETVEAVRNFRDGTSWDINGLGTLTTGVDFHPEKTSDTPPKWELLLGEETIEGFSRKVVFEEVFRDGNDDIVETGGILDSETKKGTATVSWRDREVKITTYFTNWKP